MAAVTGFTYKVTDDTPYGSSAPNNTAYTNPTVYHPNHNVGNDEGDSADRTPTEDMGALQRHRSHHVGELARQFTRQSMNTGGIENVFDYEEGSDLDPNSSNFDARKYTRALGDMIRGAGVERLAGISYRNLSVHGFGSEADYQVTVSNLPLSLVSSARDIISNRKRKVQILSGIDGVLEAGEMLVVLGPPGSGCSTLLKTIAGEMNGIYLDDKAEVNYRGITPKQMATRFRGEAIYTAEVDVHFPNLTVGQTLE